MLGAGESLSFAAGLQIWWPLLIGIAVLWLFVSHMSIRPHLRVSRYEAAERKRTDEQRECADQILIIDAHGALQ